MKKIKAREYARQHRISLFQVIKKIQNGELKGEQVEENGLSVQYVYLPETLEEEGEKTSPATESAETPESEAELVREIRLLREELRLLREQVEKCCPQRAENSGKKPTQEPATSFA